MQVTTPLSDALGKYLDLTSEQMKLTAGNMANVDTPGYRTKGFNFEQAFLGALNDATGSLGAQAPVANVDGLVSRPDGNNVSMDREGMQMAKEQLQFRFGVEVLKDQYSNVMSAIHAEDK
ncbi:flagellar basal-body rod protein FlgB [Edaphobacter acidisoli]|uniref:Flagellar basal body rod protein FlgB n=2 Tax=Edaphobacter acidisoli TaxID=2040573 RepID=A0A916W0F9_9BACT|nr:flagellar basal-body rod protein FlgB [Edaphobacter acidisoli]